MATPFILRDDLPPEEAMRVQKPRPSSWPRGGYGVFPSEIDEERRKAGLPPMAEEPKGLRPPEDINETRKSLGLPPIPPRVSIEDIRRKQGLPELTDAQRRGQFKPNANDPDYIDQQLRELGLPPRERHKETVPELKSIRDLQEAKYEERLKALKKGPQADLPYAGDPVPTSDFAGELEAKLGLRKLPYHDQHDQLGMGAGREEDRPRLWTMSRGEFEDFARTANQKTLESLEVAHSGDKMSVVRAKPGVTPQLMMHGTPYKIAGKGFRSVHVPMKSKINLPFRARHLEKNIGKPGHTSWLESRGGTDFAVNHMPDEAFHPISQDIDYQSAPPLVHGDYWNPPQPGKRWYDPEPFMERPEPGTAAPPPPVARAAPRPKAVATPIQTPAPVAPAPVAQSPRMRRIRGAIKKVKNNQTAEREAIEKKFLEMDGPADDPRRLALWPQLAVAYGEAGMKGEAATAWLHHLWEGSGQHGLDDAVHWLKTESPKAEVPPSAEEFETDLYKPHPSPADLREFAARAIVAGQNMTPEVQRQLPDILRFLEQHEDMLPPRAAWLAFSSLARNGTSEDALAITRARDRLYERIKSGVDTRDTPAFIRGQGTTNIDSVQSNFPAIHQGLMQWHDRPSGASTDKGSAVNRPFADLAKAWGLATIGDEKGAAALANSAIASIPGDEHSQWLQRAYLSRINDAIQKKPHAGPLPQELMNDLNQMEASRGARGHGRFVGDLMRMKSKILEPDSSVDKHALVIANNDFTRINAIGDPDAMANEATRAVSTNASPAAKLDLANKLMSIATRMGDRGATEFMSRMPQVVQDATAALARIPAGAARDTEAAKTFDKSGELIGNSIRAASYYGNQGLVRDGARQLLDLARMAPEKSRYEIADTNASAAIRGLRKSGLKDETGRFLGELASLMTNGQDLPTLRAASGANWPAALGGLLAVAEGWNYLGLPERAAPIMNEAENTLNTYRFMHQSKTAALAEKYLSAVSQLPTQEAIQRVNRLFKTLPAQTNGANGSDIASPLHQQTLEAAIRALVGENTTLGEHAKRWANDDEFSIRRRVNTEMGDLLRRAGM